MFFQKYRNKRKLGRGAFGQVYLVEDKDGREYAMKLISLDKIRQESYLQEYLEGEIKCMKTMNSPYIIKLYETLEDKDYIYLVLEYCDGGDLTIEQGRLPGMVYTMDDATTVLADVIRGLQYLHQEGYLHRDLKLQNILKSVHEGRRISKLADFGFSKPRQLSTGTNLGTEQFKAPEIFAEEMYGFGIDMWAFGVLFFYMLNKQYPFKLGLYQTEQKKGKMLALAAQNFSYKKAVMKTHKMLKENCTPEMEDLFERIFAVDPDKRISFFEIRTHPIFSKHFPVIEERSKILYKQPFDNSKSRVIRKSPNNLLMPPLENAAPQPSRCHPRNNLLIQEKQILGRRKDQIDFLRDNAQIFLDCKYLQPYERLMLVYNLTKYYVILLRRFSSELKVDVLNKLYPNKKWAGYSQTRQFAELTKEVSQDLATYQLKFLAYHDECELMLPEIAKSNPEFAGGFRESIDEVEFDGAFKRSYRESTRLVYQVLKRQLGTHQGNNLPYMFTMNAISHAFNQLFSSEGAIQQIFRVFLTYKNIQPKDINYTELREWLSKSSEDTLTRVVTEILTIFSTK